MSDSFLQSLGCIAVFAWFVFVSVSCIRAWCTYDTDEANQMFEFKHEEEDDE